MGVDCDFVATGETMEELNKVGMEHIKEAHPEKYAEIMKMSDSEKMEMMKQMEAKVQAAK